MAPPEASLPQPVIQHLVPSVGALTASGRQTRFTRLTNEKENLAESQKETAVLVNGGFNIKNYQEIVFCRECNVE